jgi:soluble lytic murein transglycosylase-like protein
VSAELQQVARESAVDVHLLQAIVAVESGFNANIVSRFGAVGLMQIMPDTARRVAGLVGNNKAVRRQLQDPQTNLRVGSQLLRHLVDLYGERLDLVLAAYNAGVGNVQKAGQQVPRNRETPRFVIKVSQLYASFRASSLARELGAESERSAALETLQPSRISDSPQP